MKKLFLHIGAGKTGSSALQVWLSQNKLNFKELGINYPDNRELDDYAISSGNGVFLVGIIRTGNIKNYLLELFQNENNVLFSSEVFQTLTREEISVVQNVCNDLNIELNIIIYIRDIYDVVYSLYLQTIKRHSMKLTFEDYVYGLENIEQFAVLEKYESVCSNIQVLHYDSEKSKGLDISFAEALSLNYNSLNKMKNKKVNRSLSVFESQLIRISNIIYAKKIDFKSDEFCTKVSDKIIYSNPELNTEIYYNPAIEEFLKNKYQNKIDNINSKYFKNKQLKVFDQNNKIIVDKQFEHIQEFESILSILVDLLKERIDQKELSIQDPRILNALRDEAIRVEEEDLLSAYTLMNAAKILRPGGPVIEKKLKEYEKALVKKPAIK